MMKTSVRVTQGVVKGCQEKLPNGKSFLRFSGIPYAEKPLNNLKFKAPKKLLKFETPELDCTREKDACFHRSVYNNMQFTGSEDCLYLNVYVPKVSSQEKLAVMLWIHGYYLFIFKKIKLKLISTVVLS
jgi:carboxylesterase type B